MRTWHIQETKNGAPRTIPLMANSIAILVDLPRSIDGRVLPLTVTAFKSAWVRLVRRADINGLRFHDLRHEAISRFFEMGLSVPEVALISGHRDLAR